MPQRLMLLRYRHIAIYHYIIGILSLLFIIVENFFDAGVQLFKEHSIYIDMYVHCESKKTRHYNIVHNFAKC